MAGAARTPGVDRRILRTREALRVALMDLMIEQGWDGIDVQTLCDRANIGRSTFYLHFPNKEALLKASLADLRAVLLAQALATPASTSTDEDHDHDHGRGHPLAFVPGLIDHVHEAQHVFRALLGRRSGQYVQDRFRELLVELIQHSMPETETAPHWSSDARVHFLAGGLFELLVWWLGSHRPHPPGEIAARYKRWSQAVLCVDTETPRR